MGGARVGGSGAAHHGPRIECVRLAPHDSMARGALRDDRVRQPRHRPIRRTRGRVHDRTDGGGHGRGARRGRPPDGARRRRVTRRHDRATVRADVPRARALTRPPVHDARRSERRARVDRHGRARERRRGSRHRLPEERVVPLRRRDARPPSRRIEETSSTARRSRHRPATSASSAPRWATTRSRSSPRSPSRLVAHGDADLLVPTDNGKLLAAASRTPSSSCCQAPATCCKPTPARDPRGRARFLGRTRRAA